MRSDFICLKCKKELCLNSKWFYCKKCKSKWPLFEGIPNFSKKEFYWNQIPKEKTLLLNKYARKYGWKHALCKIFDSKKELYLINYIKNPERDKFIDLIKLPKKGRILDLGCGWGSLTQSIAKRGYKIYSCDSTKETLSFVKIRLKQEKLNNVKLILIDPIDYFRLPFKDDFFDLIIFNGVLEWIGTEDLSQKPEKIQLNCLKKMRGLLKKGGYIYIGIENRFSFFSFFGEKDHNGLLFTSIMPRFLANLTSKIILNKPYRTYTYSYFGYKRLLEGAGFKEVKFLFPIPSYRDLEYILPFDRESINAYLKKSKKQSWFFKLLLWFSYVFHLEKYFVPCYSIIARK